LGLPDGPQGLTLTTASDGTVELVDGSGTAVATLPQPFARDSYVDPVTGESHDNWAMRYSVTEADGMPAVKMSLDPSWLAGSSIRFPVTVDPTMTVSTAGQTLTTYVYYPNTADYSSDTILRVGTPDGGSYIGQAFMKFLGLPDTDGYHITAADLHLFDVWAYTCSSSTSYDVYPITEQWWVTGQKSWSKDDSHTSRETPTSLAAPITAAEERVKRPSARTELPLPSAETIASCPTAAAAMSRCDVASPVTGVTFSARSPMVAGLRTRAVAESPDRRARSTTWRPVGPVAPRMSGFMARASSVSVWGRGGRTPVAQAAVCVPQWRSRSG
jgi:hypothetical protein